MIQINLLPDIKKQYLKSQQVKHTVVVASVLLGVAVLTAAVVLFGYVRIIQPEHRKNLQVDIDENIAKQKAHPDAARLVTVQNALSSVKSLQDKKQVLSRSFSYVADVTPNGISYSTISYDSTSSFLILTGVAPNTDKANELANNIKSATFTYKDGDTERSGKPFTSDRFSSPINKSEEDGTVSFTLEIAVSPELFNQSYTDIKIKVDPSSEKLLMSNSSNLFSEESAKQGEGNE